MARQFQAFVSYRRNDTFMRGLNHGDPPSVFIDNLRAALTRLGCSKIFIDVDKIGAGDFFERRIFEAISDCNLFIVLIGPDWLRLLNERAEKAKNGEPDVLAREIATALELEKLIVPLQIDGASMPTEAELQAVQDTLKPLSKISGISVASNASIETIVAALQGPAQSALSLRRLGRWWATDYFSFCAVVWFFCSFVPNAIGLREFGLEPWVGMATSWSGLFIWPVFFLPFILRALYGPFKILSEAIINAQTLRYAVTYASPILAGTAIAVLATVIEISAPQVPWTIHPKLKANCFGPDDPGPTSLDLKEEYNLDKQALAAYGSVGRVPIYYRDQFWIKDKCWPNVFFYMTTPIRERHADEEYSTKERPEIQKVFLRMLAVESRLFKGTVAPYSGLFPFYALSMFFMIWALIVSILMSIIFAVVEIHRPQDGSILEVPKEDAFLCLTYGFVTLLGWLPFRMITLSIKFSYYCVDPSFGCGPIYETFIKDGGLGFALLMGYLALTIRLAWRYKRRMLTFFGGLVVFVIGVCAVAVTKYNEQISQLVDFWQFWLVVSLLGSIMLFALWYQYDPAIVRLRDFEQGRIRTRNP
jgi:hypothetical protein